jgi:hypothetical protein
MTPDQSPKGIDPEAIKAREVKAYEKAVIQHVFTDALTALLVPLNEQLDEEVRQPWQLFSLMGPIFRPNIFNPKLILNTDTPYIGSLRSGGNMVNNVSDMIVAGMVTDKETNTKSLIIAPALFDTQSRRILFPGANTNNEFSLDYTIDVKKAARELRDPSSLIYQNLRLRADSRLLVIARHYGYLK